MNNFLLEKIALPLGDLILKTNFIKNLNFWRSFDSLSELELINYQEKQLKNQLLYAQKHISKYKGIKIDLNKKANEIIKSFPILTKDDLRSNPTSIQINNKKNVTRIYSSGST